MYIIIHYLTHSSAKSRAAAELNQFAERDINQKKKKK